MPRTAVIIVNWKVRELLRDCLRSVEVAGGLAPEDYEVIVVDNDSRDGSLEMLRRDYPHVRVIPNERNVGFGAANNQALQESTAERIILLNPDTVVLDGALAKMLDRLDADPRIAALGCRLLNADGTLQRWTAGAFPTLANVASHYLLIDKVLPGFLRPAPLYLDRDSAQPIRVDWVSGACMAIRREALNGRLFDHRFFMYAEDMELCHRLKGQGWIVCYDPRQSIVHYQGASLQQQRSDIMLSSLKGPRYFFELIHGRRAARILDVLSVAGFGLRWLLYSAGAKLRPAMREIYGDRAVSSRHYLNLALNVMREVRHGETPPVASDT